MKYSLMKWKNHIEVKEVTDTWEGTAKTGRPTNTTLYRENND